MPRRKAKYVLADERAALAAAAPKSAPQPAEPWPQYMTFEVAAKYFSQSYWPIYRWIRRGAKDGKLVINKKLKAWTVCKDDLDRLWREGSTAA